MNIGSFIQTIYLKFGNKFYQVCVIPLVSTIIVDVFITQVVLLFIASFLVFFIKNKYFLHNKIFDFALGILIPKNVEIIFQNIIGFQDFYNNVDYFKLRAILMKK